MGGLILPAALKIKADFYKHLVGKIHLGGQGKWRADNQPWAMMPFGPVDHGNERLPQVGKHRVDGGGGQPLFMEIKQRIVWFVCIAQIFRFLQSATRLLKLAA